MRPFRGVVFALLIAQAARADVITRAAAAGEGGGAPSAMENDLIAWAGQPKAITLPELLQLAVRQNPQLQNARLDIAIAEAQIGETWERSAWKVFAQGTGQKQTSFFSGIAIQSQAYGIGADLVHTFSTGGTLDIHGSTQWNDSTSTFGSSRYWLDTASVSLTQPLLKGWGSELFDSSQRKAELLRDVDVLARRLAAINTVQAVVSGYWDLVLAERQVAITEQSLDLARERLRVTEIGAKGGKIADAEIPAVQQIIATREEDVLNGELAVLTASLALRRVAGMEITGGDIGLRVGTDLEIPDRKWELQSLIEHAYQSSPELAQLAKQDQSAQIDIYVNDNGLLPQLDAALSFGPLGEDAVATNAAKDMAEFKTILINGSLTFSRSLSQYDVRYRSRELRTGRQKLRVNAFDVRAQYAQAMARAVAQIELAQRRVVLSQRAIDLANENIKIETNRFNLGTRTNFDVLNRLEDLRQAELRKAQAMVDWHKAEVQIQALTGDILPAFGITVD